MSNGNNTQTRAARMLAFITENLNAGKTVYIQTVYKTSKCSKKNVGMFKVVGESCFMQRGKNWDCIDYCRVSAQ